MFKINGEKDLTIHTIQMMMMRKKKRKTMNLKKLYKRKSNLGMRLIFYS
jgi:hypothetical protein